MVELKTKKNSASVKKFIASVVGEQKQKDTLELLKIFEEVTKEKAKMWGSSIIGFGEYHYKSERSSQEGDWPLTGFSPRKSGITIYIMPGFSSFKDLLKTIGIHKVSKGSCLYIKKLSDIHIPTLKKLIRASVKEMKTRYGVK